MTLDSDPGWQYLIKSGRTLDAYREAVEDAKSWPKGVRPLGPDDVFQLGLDEKNRLYWKGERVHTEATLTLNRWQTVAAIAAAGAAVLGTCIGAADLLLKVLGQATG